MPLRSIKTPLSMVLPDVDGCACSAAIMFESTPPRPRRSGERARDATQDEVLRELSWSELVARLSAERDLRRQLSASHDLAAEPSAASFDVESASTVVTGSVEAGWNYERGVNHKISAYRKAGEGRRDADDTGRGDHTRDRLHDPRT